MGKYRPLALEERYQIAALKQSGVNGSEIARILNRDRSTVSREIRRHSDRNGNYYAQLGHDQTVSRRKRPRLGRRKVQKALEYKIKEALFEHWSPEQISGRLKAQHGIEISTNAIYRYVYRQCLERLLRRKGHKKRFYYELKRGKIPGKRMISERPQEINDRQRTGDFERDFMQGKRASPALLVFVDRKSRYTKVELVTQRTSDEVNSVTVRQLSQENPKSLTNDNGTEFANFKTTEAELKIPIYFTHPYCSWEKGTVENTNGLLRQYFPKKSDFSKIGSDQVQSACERLNHRPRKILGFQTPHEVYTKAK